MIKSSEVLQTFGNLDNIFAYGSTIGSRDAALSTNLRGFYQGGGLPTNTPNMDRNGYVFFTRPQLNLSAHNCMRTRLLYNLLTRDEKSLQTWVRATLDPRLYSKPDELGRSYHVDNTNPFIPILTNNITSLSGWPDLVVPTRTSPEGVRKEVQSVVDGVMEYYQEFDLDATFYNTQDDPITHLLYTWEKYMTLVLEGMANPYPDFIVENEMDYNTRIYRIITDYTGKYVSKIAACGAAIPISIPTSDYANYTKDQPLSTGRKDLTVRFRCNGAIYFDPVLLQEFNETVFIFNPTLRDEALKGTLKLVSSNFMKVDRIYQPMFNGLLIPYIDLDTNELCWLVDTTRPDAVEAIDKYETARKESRSNR